MYRPGPVPSGACHVTLREGEGCCKWKVKDVKSCPAEREEALL